MTDGIYQVRGFDLSNITFVEGDTGVIVIDPADLDRDGRGGARVLPRASWRPAGGRRDLHALARRPLRRREGRDHAGGGRRRSGARDRARRDSSSTRSPRTSTPARPWPDAPRTCTEPRSRGTSAAASAPASGRPRRPARSPSSRPPSTSRTPARSSRSTACAWCSRWRPEPRRPPRCTSTSPIAGRCAWPRTPRTRCTTCSRSAARSCATRTPGPDTSPRRSSRSRGDADVAFASHHWPTWGTDRIVEFLSAQRDLYAYLHDQTLRLLNQGYTGIEIAELIELPPALEAAWSTHGYYGSVSHNVKAIYQRYMGWYDGNPARLWQHTPVEAGTRYVDFMGGADAVVEKARVLVRGRRPAAGRRRCSTTWSSQSPTTPRRRRCSPTRSSSSASAARTARGAARPVGRDGAARRLLRHADGRGIRRHPRAAHPRPLLRRRRDPGDGPKAWDLDLATRLGVPRPRTARPTG